MHWFCFSSLFWLCKSHRICLTFMTGLVCIIAKGLVQQDRWREAWKHQVAASVWCGCDSAASSESWRSIHWVYSNSSRTAAAVFLHYDRISRSASRLNLGRKHSFFAVTEGSKELVPFLVTLHQKEHVPRAGTLPFPHLSLLGGIWLPGCWASFQVSWICVACHIAFSHWLQWD